MSQNRPALGISLMIATSFIFATQDGISRHLAGTYNVLMIVMIRYWILSSVALTWAATQSGGIRGIARTPRPWLQFTRSAVLALEVIIAIQSFVYLGLVETLAIFGCFPLIVAALSGPILGEHVGWRRWSAILLGFVGILIILRPGFRVFDPAALLPICSAILFAFYQILTRLAGRNDSAATSFLWMGVVGAVILTLVGPASWEPMIGRDWGWMLALAALAICGHFCLIFALNVTQASTVQPFTYLHLVFASIIGVVIFDESVDQWTILGAALVVAAGVFTILRQGRASAVALQNDTVQEVENRSATH